MPLATCGGYLRVHFGCVDPVCFTLCFTLQVFTDQKFHDALATIAAGCSGGVSQTHANSGLL
jgi:hypothetical protein